MLHLVGSVKEAITLSEKNITLKGKENDKDNYSTYPEYDYRSSKAV